MRHAGPVEPVLSAVVVAVPEAEPHVGALRAALDPSAALGVPPHVTIMYPFLPPAEIDDGALAVLGETLAAVAAFDVEFSRVAWFGEEVVWWAPEPAEPFVVLTGAVARRFGLRPYEGAHGDIVVPHLTIGHDAPIARLKAAAADVAGGRPLHATVQSVRVMTGSTEPRSWSTVAELPLGGR
jgi:2'-5' RNA ligase